MKKIKINFYLLDEIKGFYKQAVARKVIPEEYKKAIEWFIKQLEDFDF